MVHDLLPFLKLLEIGKKTLGDNGHRSWRAEVGCEHRTQLGHVQIGHSLCTVRNLIGLKNWHWMPVWSNPLLRQRAHSIFSRGLARDRMAWLRTPTGIFGDAISLLAGFRLLERETQGSSFRAYTVNFCTRRRWTLAHKGVFHLRHKVAAFSVIFLEENVQYCL